MKKITTVLFDFDGTVMDTTGVILASWQHTYRTLLGREHPVEEILKTFGEPLTDSMEKAFPDTPVEEAVAIYRGYHWERFEEMIRLFPGMAELLGELRARGYKLGLVTSRLRGTTQRGLDKYDLGQYFSCVVTCDDTDKHKPDPEPVRIALDRLGARPEESLMVGDTVFDILCARNAGVESVLVAWQETMSPEEISGPDGPDYCIETPEELIGILESKEGE